MQYIIASALKQERVAGIKKSCAWVWEGKWLMVNKKVVKVARLTAFLVDCSHTKYCKRQDGGPASLSCRPLRRNSLGFWERFTSTLYFRNFLWKLLAFMFKCLRYLKKSLLCTYGPNRVTINTPHSRVFFFAHTPASFSRMIEWMWYMFIVFHVESD